MKITFFSNFMNHHQLPFCLEMVELLGKDNFKFVATEKIPQDRLDMGYEDMNKKYDFIVRSYENEEDVYKLGYESDVIIIGSAPTKYIWKRLKSKKLTFRYSERIYKNGFKIKTFLSVLIKKTFFERNVYLLCSSAYSSKDYSLSGAYINKCYKWGYFPKVKEYEDIKKLMDSKKKNSILWVARFIEVKHPEIVVELGKKLKENNLNFEIKMIGIGPLEDKIKKDIKKYKLENNIHLLGSMSPDNVRKNMEKSSMFLFTSDRGEGWGAVLNESMNSGCAVIASHEIGSVPFLLEDAKNGLIYEDGNIDDLYNNVVYLLKNNNISKRLGLEAYKTMINLWNAKVAAKRILELSNNLINKKNNNEYDDGPCSKSKILKDNWFLKRCKVENKTIELSHDKNRQ